MGVAETAIWWRDDRRISGCRCTLGCKPMPMARRMALAILRWLTGRSPVLSECLILPMGVMKSEMREKFWCAFSLPCCMYMVAQEVTLHTL